MRASQRYEEYDRDRHGAIREREHYAVIAAWRCLRCDYLWPRAGPEPERCAKCNSPYWRTLRGTALRAAP